MNDLKFAFRQLLKNPGFTAVAVLTLALGIGANTAIFSVMNSVLLRPLPFKNPERLMMIREMKLPQFSEFAVATGNFMEWVKQSASFTHLVGMRPMTLNLADPGNPELLKGLSLTGGFCAMLGVTPQLGRDFLPEEAQPGRNEVVLLSHQLWQQRFGGNLNIINQTIPIDGQSYTVVGVMPAGFEFLGGKSEVWTLIALTAQDAENHSGHTLSRVVGKLKPGVSIHQAGAELSTIEGRLATQFPQVQGWNVRFWSLLEFTVRSVKPALLVLLAAVAFVLLIACINVGNLQLMRATSRRKEIALRTALGAGRARIVRQLLTESVLLSLLGGALGLVIAIWGTNVLLRLTPVDLPRFNGASLDGGMLAFTGALAVLTGLVFGLAPALQASEPNLNEVMNNSGRGSAEGARRHWFRSTLVVMEVASALVLLVGAGLLLRSFAQLQKVNPGFRTENVLTLRISLPKQKYSEDPKVIGFYGQLLEKVSTLPGVLHAGATSLVPISDDDFVISFESENKPANAPGVISHTANFFAISGAYFNAMGIPLLRGRYINDQDTVEMPHVAVINESLARKLFPDQDPIGNRITFDDRSKSPDWHEIVGVVGDVKTYGLDQATTMQIYESFPQQVPRTMTIVVKTSGQPSGVPEAIRNMVLSLDKVQPVAAVITLNQLLSTSIAQRYFSMLLVAIFAMAALSLAAVGTYGVFSYAATQRTKEIGVRMALGAQAHDVERLLVRQGMVLAFLGVGVGLVGAFAVTRLMSTLLFGIRPADPFTFGIAFLVLTSVSLIACWLPARRAALMDPMAALRAN